MTDQVPSKEIDTPRTDAVVADGWSGDAACVSYKDCQAIERDLTADVERLQLELDAMKAAYDAAYQGAQDWMRRAAPEPPAAPEKAAQALRECMESGYGVVVEMVDALRLVKIMVREGNLGVAQPPGDGQ